MDVFSLFHPFISPHTSHFPHHPPFKATPFFLSKPFCYVKTSIFSLSPSLTPFIERSARMSAVLVFPVSLTLLNAAMELQLIYAYRWSMCVGVCAMVTPLNVKRLLAFQVSFCQKQGSVSVCVHVHLLSQ